MVMLQVVKRGPRLKLTNEGEMKGVGVSDLCHQKRFIAVKIAPRRSAATVPCQRGSIANEHCD